MSGKLGRFKIYADFNNADSEGRLRLNVRGSLADLKRIGSELAPGLEVELESADLRCRGLLARSNDEEIWVAVIDWSSVEDRST